MWFLSPETGLPDREVAEMRRELFLRQRKLFLHAPPGIWRRFHTFRSTVDATRFTGRVNRGTHPILRSALGRFEAEHLFNLAYVIYRPKKGN